MQIASGASGPRGVAAAENVEMVLKRDTALLVARPHLMEVHVRSTTWKK